MPYINLKILEGATREEKARLVEIFTDGLVQVLGKEPEHIHMVIDDIHSDNWGFGGALTSEQPGRFSTRQ